MEQQPKINVNVKDTTPIECDECKGQVFVEGLMLRKLSKFLAGTEQDAVIPIQVFACQKCGHVNNQFLPAEIKE